MISRLLRLSVQGVDLYEDSKFSLDLFATDRVINPDGSTNPGSVHRVLKRGSIYSQNVLGIAGINASGKTTTLKLLMMALSLLGGSAAFRHYTGAGLTPVGRVGDKLTFTTVFARENSIYLLKTHFVASPSGESNLSSNGLSSGYSIADETLWRYEGKRINRAVLANTEQLIASSRVLYRRNGADNDSTVIPSSQRAILDPDRSIAALLEGDRFEVQAPLRLLPEETLPDGVVQAFDGNIEYLRWDPESEVFLLKFKDGGPRYVSRNVATQILSTGTVLGSEMVVRAIDVLRAGGYLLVDEIEQSLNKSLVSAIIGLFASPRTNPHGAQLVFTTHYTQILDSLRRNDNIYLFVRGDDYKTRALKLSEQFSRDDFKKSDVIMSNAIRGANPKYEDVKRLNDYVASRVAE